MRSCSSAAGEVVGEAACRRAPAHARRRARPHLRRVLHEDVIKVELALGPVRRPRRRPHDERARVGRVPLEKRPRRRRTVCRRHRRRGVARAAAGRAEAHADTHTRAHVGIASAVRCAAATPGRRLNLAGRHAQLARWSPTDFSAMANAVGRHSEVRRWSWGASTAAFGRASTRGRGWRPRVASLHLLAIELRACRRASERALRVAPSVADQARALALRGLRGSERERSIAHVACERHSPVESNLASLRSQGSAPTFAGANALAVIAR